MSSDGLGVKIAKWTAISALFIIPLLPLYVAGGGASILGSLFFPFITGKGFLFRILIEVAVGAWVVLMLADKRYRPQFSWTLLIYGLFVLWMFIADLFGANPHKAFWSNYERMDGWVTMIHVFFFFLVSSSVFSVNKLWKHWWLMVVGSSFIVSLHGILQLMGNAQIHQGGTRVDANFGNAAYLAAYLLFTIAASLWLSIQSKGWLRYSLLALALLETVILYHTATRGALLGFVGAAIVAAGFWTFSGGKKGRTVGVSVLLGILLLVGGFFALKNTTFIQNDKTLTRIASISAEDGSTRFTLWHMALQGVAERPILGWGQEGYNFIFNKYYEPSLYEQETWFDRAHSVYIDWLVAGGIPALLLFLAFVTSILVALLKSPVSRAERILLGAAVLAYAFQALFVFDNIFTYIFLAAVAAVAHSGTARTITRLDEKAELSTSSINSIALPAVGVLTIAVLWFVNIPSIYGSQQLIKGLSQHPNPTENIAYFKNALTSGTFAMQEVREQYIGFASQVAKSEAIPATVRSDVLTDAVGEMGKELENTPQDSRLRIMLAQGYEAAGDFAGAVRELEVALVNSPKKQTIIIQKGIEHWKAGDKASARATFESAYALDTSFAELAVYVAAGDILTGDTPSAKALLNEKFGTTTLARDILLYAYFETQQFDDLVLIAQQKVVDAKGAAQNRYELAQIYALIGRMAAARAEIEATIAAFPETAASGQQMLEQLKGK